MNKKKVESINFQCSFFFSSSLFHRVLNTCCWQCFTGKCLCFLRSGKGRVRSIERISRFQSKARSAPHSKKLIARDINMWMNIFSSYLIYVTFCDFKVILIIFFFFLDISVCLMSCHCLFCYKGRRNNLK